MSWEDCWGGYPAGGLQANPTPGFHFDADSGVA